VIGIEVWPGAPTEAEIKSKSGVPGWDALEHCWETLAGCIERRG